MKTTYYDIGRKLNIKVALIADTHDKSADGVIASVKENAPDVVCMTGDIVHKGDLSAAKNVDKLIKACVSVAPTLLSLGNHDRGLTDKDFGYLADNGVKVLTNDCVYLKGAYFGGFPSLRGKSGDDVKKSLAFIKDFKKKDGFKILLCHHPEYYDKFALDDYVDLVLSGHAHGGQIRLFGRGLFAPDQGVLPKYTKGVYDKKLIVSAGLAKTGGPIPRLFNPTEIVYINI